MSTSNEPDRSPWWKRWRPRFGRTPTFQADASRLSRQQDQDLVMSLSTRRIPGLKQLGALSSVLQPADKRAVKIWSSLAILSLLVLLGQELWTHLSTAPQSGGTLT